MFLRFVKMTFVHRLRFNTHKRKTRSHLAECESLKNTVSCSTNPVRQLGHMRFVQSIQTVEATNCSCTNTAVLDTCISIRTVIALSWAFQVIAKMRSVSPTAWHKGSFKKNSVCNASGVLNAAAPLENHETNWKCLHSSASGLSEALQKYFPQPILPESL